MNSWVWSWSHQAEEEIWQETVPLQLSVNLRKRCAVDLEPWCLEENRQAICSHRCWRISALCRFLQGKTYCLAKHSCPTECESTCGELLYEIPIHPWQNVIPSMFMFNARSYSTALQYSCGWTVMRMLEERCKWTVLCTWQQPLSVIQCPRGWHSKQFLITPS